MGLADMPVWAAWILLILAGGCEVGWALSLKFIGSTDGWLKAWPIAGTLAGLTLSGVLMALVVRKISLGTAYAVWTGIGATGTAAVGMALFNESRNWRRIAALLMIVGGVVVLKYADDESTSTAEAKADRVHGTYEKLEMT